MSGEQKRFCAKKRAVARAGSLSLIGDKERELIEGGSSLDVFFRERKVLKQISVL